MYLYLCFPPDLIFICGLWECHYLLITLINPSGVKIPGLWPVGIFVHIFLQTWVHPWGLRECHNLPIVFTPVATMSLKTPAVDLLDHEVSSQPCLVIMDTCPETVNQY